jgi:hypothetical protein
MEKIIYRFLDEYLGDGVSYEREPINFFVRDSESVDCGYRYSIYSKKDRTVILFVNHFNKNGSAFKIFGGYSLTNTVSKFFDIDTNNAAEIIKNWFMVKHNLKNNSDLLLISEKYLVKNDLTFF